MSRLSEAAQLRNLAASLLKVHQTEEFRKTTEERERNLSEATSLLQTALSKFNSASSNNTFPSLSTTQQSSFPPPKPASKRSLIDQAATIAGTPPETLGKARKYLSGALSDHEDDSPITGIYSSLLAAAKEAEVDSAAEIKQLAQKQDILQSKTDSLEQSLIDLHGTLVSVSQILSNFDTSSINSKLSNNQNLIADTQSKINETEQLALNCYQRTEKLSKVIDKHVEVVESLPGILRSTAQNTCSKMVSSVEDRVVQLQSNFESKMIDLQEEINRSRHLIDSRLDKYATTESLTKFNSDLTKSVHRQIRDEFDRQSNRFLTPEVLSKVESELLSKCDELINANISNVSAKISKKTLRAVESVVTEALSAAERKAVESAQKYVERQLKSRPVDSDLIGKLADRVTELSERVSSQNSTITTLQSNLAHIDKQNNQLSTDFDRHSSHSLQLAQISDSLTGRLDKIDDVIRTQSGAYEEAFVLIKEKLSSLTRKINVLEGWYEEKREEQSEADFMEKIVSKVTERLNQKSKKGSIAPPLSNATREVQSILQETSSRKMTSPLRSRQLRTAQSPSIDDYLTSQYQPPTDQSIKNERDRLSEEALLLTISPRKNAKKPEPHPSEFATPRLFTPQTVGDFESKVHDIRRNFSQL
ncbi:hypothetical protein RCL1_001128 [Eukaryota sp. TZLM3-RCL]